MRARHGEHLAFSGSSSLIEDKIRPLMGRDDTILSGIMNFGNNIGFFDFSIFANGICEIYEESGSVDCGENGEDAA